MTEQTVMAGDDFVVEPAKEVEPLAADTGADETPVVPLTNPTHVPHFLQTIQEPSRIRNLRDQPIPDLVTAQPRFTCAPEDSERVVLGGRELVWPERLAQGMLEQRRGAGDAQMRFLLQAGERLVLLQLALQLRRHGQEYMCCNTRCQDRDVGKRGPMTDSRASSFLKLNSRVDRKPNYDGA